MSQSPVKAIKVLKSELARYIDHYINPVQLNKYPIAKVIDEHDQTIAVILSPKEYAELTKPLTMENLPDYIKQALIASAGG